MTSALVALNIKRIGARARARAKTNECQHHMAVHGPATLVQFVNVVVGADVAGLLTNDQLTGR